MASNEKVNPLNTLFILVVASLFAFMGVRELMMFESSTNHIVYPDDSIALTYKEVHVFKEFLLANASKRVYIDAQLRFDVATNENLLIQEACGYADFREDLIDNPRGFNNLRIGLVSFSSATDELNLDNLKCDQTFSFTDVPIYQLNFTYDNTGALSLHIQGLFDISAAPPSSQVTHYTLTRVPNGVL